ncbi:MAG: hypothetical protein NW207_06005 [Cytophagales bacterium]|nr:hypothetical protein [Cytophagales bacterium]
MRKSLIYLYLTVAIHTYSQSYVKTIPAKGISLMLPDSFVPMSDDDMAAKYPSYKKPLAVYTNESRTADFGVNFAANRWETKDLNMLKNFYLSTYKSLFKRIEYKAEGEIKRIKKRPFLVFEFISEFEDENAPDEYSKSTSKKVVRNYTLIQYTIVDKYIFIFHFTCPANDKNKYINLAHHTLASVKVSNNVEFEPFKPIKRNVKPAKK